MVQLSAAELVAFVIALFAAIGWLWKQMQRQQADIDRLMRNLMKLEKAYWLWYAYAADLSDKLQAANLPAPPAPKLTWDGYDDERSVGRDSSRGG